MNRNILSFSLLVLTLAGFGGCSSKPAGDESKKAAPDKIQGKAQVIQDSNITEAAMNAGGPSVYLVDGLRRYRLFLNKPVEVVAGKQYVAEGVYAQKAIDDMGDPDNGKNGYPLPGRCESVVKMAWSGLAFDVTGGHASALCAKVKRYPARAIFLVTRLQPLDSKSGADSKKDQAGEEKEIPEISVPADKQRAALMEGPSAQTAPLWDPAGKTVNCKVVIGPDGKVSELETGMQLCEAVPWSQYRYQPPVQRGHPVKVKTEVEVRFEPRK